MEVPRLVVPSRAVARDEGTDDQRTTKKQRVPDSGMCTTTGLHRPVVPDGHRHLGQPGCRLFTLGFVTVTPYL